MGLSGCISVVECLLAKQKVVGSNPIIRSTERIKMSILNPCRKCLIKAVCNEKCDLYEKWGYDSASFGLIISTFLYSFVLIITIYTGFIFNVIVPICIYILLWSASIFLCSYVIEDLPDIKISGWISFIYTPWIVCVVFIRQLITYYYKWRKIKIL